MNDTNDSFLNILAQFRARSFSERNKGERFERLMRAYLLTDPNYASRFKQVWMWEDFAARRDFGGRDSGIDLVAQTHEGDYWAIQCKCYAAETLIDKPAVDSFLATSSREFLGDDLRTTRFKHRLWISTTHRWGPNAEEAIRNQSPPVSRIGLYDLTQAPVEWARLERDLYGAAARAAQKTIRPHQQKALEATHAHFQTADRGKLIMACGTGKTYTALKIAEHETQGQGLVLFLVPSIALMGQTLREWTAEASVPLEAICICSDAKVTRKRTRGEDGETGSVIDLALPASTDVDTIVRQIQAQRLAPKQGPKQGMTVVFSTYQSIEVVAKAQAAWRRQNATSQTHGTGLADGIFDLVICDEAHRTTGVTLASDDESSFVRVHDNAFLQARKRLYMTATPRLYSDDSKSKAAQANAELCSMDDERLYGAEIYRIGFGEAVEKSLLTDYKVIVLTMNEADVPKSVQAAIADPNNEISTDDASKLIGCINALSKKILGDAGILSENDPEPMRRAVAFCQSIEASKKIMSTFNNTGAVYLEAVPAENRAGLVNVVVDHVDGTMSALTRDEKLAWLKETPNYETNTCRILSNARCLSEGVDVPSLDAVLFLSARNSQVDVVQSVGRVMRRAEGKKYGYIIIPVVFPNHVKPEDALNDNERFKVVWSVLNALRAHDDRFNATVNKIELNRQRPSQILVGGVAHRSEAQDGAANTAGAGQAEQPSDAARAKIQQQMALQFGELQNAIFAKMVQKVGDRRYWEQWAANVAEIAERYVARITRMVAETGPHQAAFEAFLDGLRRNINPAIMPDEAIEMLAQHVITKPVFEALFEGYSFVQHNPVSQAMQHMLEVLEAQSLEKDAASLDKFYESVRKRASGIDNAEGKQRIIIELYDKFFRTAFPKLVEKLGIVYTPVEVVDFIIHSVDDVLRREFGCGLSDEQVHILDPFTGTGTFMTRLLQSGLIKPEDLARKYAHELHANEIVLLAYYIAAINIENAYHDQVGMGDGVLGVGDRVLGMGDRVLGMGERGSGIVGEGGKSNDGEGGKDQFVQGTAGVAGGDELGGIGVSGDQALSQRGDVWLEQSDAPRRGVDSGQYRGGLRAGDAQGLSAFFDHRQRLAVGIGDASLDRPAPLSAERDHAADPQSTPNSGQNLNRPPQITQPPTLTPPPPIPHPPTLHPIPHTLHPLPSTLHPTPSTLHPTPSTLHPIPHTPTYTPFNGICLTDTFQLGENEDGDRLFSEMFPQNSARVLAQKTAPIRVIMGNPPYSVGQKSANDNAQNQDYPHLNARIAATYAAQTDATNKNSLYDSYIKAFRWASDRLAAEVQGGIVAFVSNGAWLDGNSADGLRKCLQREFASIYVFNLRGNARTSGELRQKEAGNVFGSGSRTPIAITLLVKKPNLGASTAPTAQIFYCDIGDYLSREDKLKRLKAAGTMTALDLVTLAPNVHGDWLSQRDDMFGTFIGLGDKDDKSNTKTFFVPHYSKGLMTARDTWCYNSSKPLLVANIKSTLDFYNQQRIAFHEARKNNANINARDFIAYQDNAFSWSDNPIMGVEGNKAYEFEASSVVSSVYRPFFKQFLYFNRTLNERVYQMPKLFPKLDSKNRVICVSGVGVTKDFSTIITDTIPDLELIGKSQCFPLYYYETREKQTMSLFDQSDEREEYVRRDGVSDWIWAQAQTRYGRRVTKEDLFYYVYGFLHSPVYRERFAADLKKMLPRLPLVEEVRDFWAFSRIGKLLADLHVDYENVPAPHAERGVRVIGVDEAAAHNTAQFRVEQMRFPAKTDKGTILYNSRIRVEGIPAAAYDYVVNGKSAIEWVMERYTPSTHKDSSIHNDPNDWALEQGKPRYILDLLLSVIHLSLKTVELVKQLPAVTFGE